MKQERKRKMADVVIASSLGGQNITQSGFIRLLDNLWGTTRFVEEEEETVDMLLMNKGFIKEVERVKKDFKKNHADLQKFPKVNDDIWK